MSDSHHNASNKATFNPQLPTPDGDKLPSLKDLNLLPANSLYPTPEELFMQQWYSFSAPILGHRQHNPWMPPTSTSFQLQPIGQQSCQLASLPNLPVKPALAVVQETDQRHERNPTTSESRRQRNREAAVRYRSRQIEHQERLEASLKRMASEHEALSIEKGNKEEALQKLRKLVVECNK